MKSKQFNIKGAGYVGQITALAIAGYRVIAPDLRGMGQTSSPYGMWLQRFKFCLIQKCFKLNFDFFCLFYLSELIVLDQTKLGYQTYYDHDPANYVAKKTQSQLVNKPGWLFWHFHLYLSQSLFSCEISARFKFSKSATENSQQPTLSDILYEGTTPHAKINNNNKNVLACQKINM